MAEKRFYWLNLPTDFLDSLVIKKLRKMAGGDTYTIIALKILLKGATADNKIYYQGIEDTFEKEVAAIIGESEIDTEIVITILLRCGWITKRSKYCYYVSKAADMTGSESDAARRKRRSRAKIAGLLSDDSEGFEGLIEDASEAQEADSLQVFPTELENDDGCDNVTEMSHVCHTEENENSLKTQKMQFVVAKENNNGVCDNVTEMSQPCHRDVTLLKEQEKEKNEKKKEIENFKESMFSSLRSEKHTKEVCEKSDGILEKAPRNRDVAKVLPEWLREHGVENGEELHDVLDAFAEMRVRIRKPLTARAVKLNLNEAWKLSNGDVKVMIQIFDQSISNSWCGVFALRENLLTKPFPAQLRGGQAGFSTGVYEQMKDEEVPF